MFAVYAAEPNPNDPLAALRVGERPSPSAEDGWVVVNVRAASLNMHDLWTLRGVGISADRLPIVLGCDGAGVDSGGNEVVLHSVIADPHFGGGDETIISQQFDKPVMVHRYPTAVKAFYMEPDPARPEVALCVDVLAPEGYGEIVGGGQRIASYDLLAQRIKEHDLPREAFEWYLDLRKFGSVPHSGFGMGIERAVTWICGLEHVRETIPFPRMLYRLNP